MNAAKDKGTKAETAVVIYARGNGQPAADRAPLRGSADTGDVSGISAGVLGEMVVQVKNVQRMDLAGWVDEMQRQVLAAGALIGAVWHKRRGKPSPGDWYVTMTGADFIKLLEGR